MSFLFDVNNAAMTGAQAIFNLKELLKSAGWVVKSSGDGGSIVSTTTDIINSGSSGANGLANTNAWFRIQMSTIDSVNREFIFQRGSSNLLWTIKYSYSVGFTGGSITATSAPTATDSQTLLNASTLFPADSGYRWNAAAGGSSDGYAFWSGVFPIGGGVPSGGAVCLFRLVDGSYPTEDIDPYVIYVDGSTTPFLTTSMDNAIKAWMRKGMTYENFKLISTGKFIQATNAVFPNFAGVNPHNGNDDVMPMPMIGATTAGGVIPDYPTGYKGLIDTMMWNGTSRTTGDTLSIASAGAKDRIVYRDVNLVWDGSTPTV